LGSQAERVGLLARGTATDRRDLNRAMPAQEAEGKERALTGW